MNPCDCADCAPEGKTLSPIEHYRNGRRYGYPRCCCLRFALDSHGSASRGVRYTGAVDAGQPVSFMPCGIFHRAHLTADLLDNLERWANRKFVLDVIADGNLLAKINELAAGPR